MPDRLREDELRGRRYRGGDRREPDFERPRGFEEGRFGEHGYFGRGYGRDWGSERGRYGGFQGPARETYNPRSDYDWGRYPYSPEYGEGPLYGGGISYERGRGDFGRPYGYGPEYERDYARTPWAAGRYYGEEGYGRSPREELRPPPREFGLTIHGDFRGRGPRGYARPDERIREDVCDRLTDDPSIDPSNVDVRVAGGEVTLEGTVDSRDEKRRAEDIAESVSGVRNIQNLLRYETAERGRTSGTAPGTAGEAPERPARSRERARHQE